ncbi:hypothetical protein N9U18_00745 [Candidatus Pelagibacter sp.]|nr:hypothetical protein [Candidatus Pelagibacter sp.]MDA9709172.1 hypothetical protein [Candidatus Pelagibacter sp.]
MIRFAKHFIVYLFLVSCGFQSIYVSDRSDFSFNKSNALGDIKISKDIIRNLESLKKNEGEYELIIETIFTKDISSKNKKGDPEVFDMSLDVNLMLKSDRDVLKSQFREKLSYNNLKSKFELKQYENNLKSNLVQEITQDILIYLNSI